MNNYKIVDGEKSDLNYEIKHSNVKVMSKDRGLVYVTCILIFTSLIIFILQVFDIDIIKQLRLCKRIQRNVNTWQGVINNITESNIIAGKQLALKINASGLNFYCYDYGSFYLPMRLNPNTYLPEAIRRGNGDGWSIAKAATIDPSANQFCTYVISKYSTNTITCGTDMYSKIQYSGWLETGHWCQTAFTEINSNTRI